MVFFSFPVQIICAKNFDFYTLPIHGIPAFKIGIDAGGPATTAETRNFQPDPVREKLVADFIKTYIPKVR